MAGRSQDRLRFRDGADHLGRTAYSMNERSLKTALEQQAAAAARGVNAAPACTVLPAITGTTTEGSTLTCSTGTWTSATSDSKTYAYQWFRGQFLISGATANTRVLTQADTGYQMCCRVIATDENGSAATVSLLTTAVAEAGAPTNTVLPAITGTATVGQTLTGSTGTWTSATAETPTYTRQWRRDGVAISAATASTYVLVGDDSGTDITVTVTATDSNGSTAATSAATAIA